MTQESAASMLRLLHAKDAPLDRSLAVARQLQAALRLSQGRPDDAGIEMALANRLRLAPANVRAHYQRMLLDWTVLSLSKASAPPASLESLATKKRKLNSGGRAKLSQADHQALDSLQELWVLLEALLRMPGAALGSAAHPALAEAAARTCQLALTQMQSKAPSRVAQHHAAVAAPAAVEKQDIDSQIPLAVLGSMEWLQKGHNPQTFSSSARFAEAALQAAAACAEQYSQGKSTDTWCKLAAQAVSQLMAACKSQSDPKKTFKTVVTRLLVPILIMNPRKEGGTASWRALVSTARQLLEAVLFSNEHLVPLQALALASLNPVPPDGQDVEHAPALDAEKPEHEGRAAQKAPRQSKYAALLPEAISRELAEGKHTGLPEFLGGLPWLLVRFRAALKRPQPAEPAKASHRGPNQDSGGPSAEFAFFALLLQLLMDPVLAAFQEPTASSPPSNNTAASHARQCMLAVGIAKLLQVAAAQGVYKPTQDREGLQRQILERTGKAIFQWCLTPPGHPDNSPSEHSDSVLSDAEQEAAASRQALSAARVLEGLMDMEHRAVQPALDQLWAVIWRCALLEEGKTPAVRVATAMLKAYGELRQLVPLLESLAAALGSPKCPESAHTVISDTRFQEALHKVVQEAPPGQRTALVGFVAAAVRTTLKPHMTGPALATLTLLLTGALKGVRVETTTASAVATAVEGLISNSLGKPLSRALSLDWKDAVTDSTSTHEIAALLQLYGTALAAHAACAAMQPQVLPLPGQAIIMDPHAGESAMTGYFDALLGEQEGCKLCSLNSLAVNYATHFKGLLQGEDQPGLAALWQAVATCQMQRMDVLHERLLHLEYSCPAVPAAQTPGAALPAAQPAAAAGAAEAAGESESEDSAPAESDAEGEEAEEAPLQATLKQRTCNELSQVANGLTGLCMLNDMAKLRKYPPNDKARDVLAGIGVMIQHYHGLILRHTGILVKQNFLTSLLGGAARQQRLQRSEPNRSSHSSSESRSGAATASRPRGDADADGLSFSAAALQLLEGQEFWETAELAERWPLAFAGKLETLCNGIVKIWSLLTPEDDASSESDSQPQQSTEEGTLAGTREQFEACVQMLQQVSAGQMFGYQGFEPANKLHKEAIEYAKQAAEYPPQCATAPQRGDSAVCTDISDALAAAEGLFRLLCSIPPQWLDLHEFETWSLFNIALAVQSFLLRLSAVYSGQISACLDPSQAPRARAALVTASAAVQGFMARVAACRSTMLRGVLEQPCKCGLNWPFQVASALQEFLAPPPTSSSTHADPPLDAGVDPAMLQGTHRLLEASAAVLHHTSRHLLLDLGHPVAGERSMRVVREWMEGVRSPAPHGSSAQLHHAQQLEAVCAALLSAAAVASSAEPESEAAGPNTRGPSIGTGLFARPHLLRLIAELASMLNAELAALSTVSRDASPVVELQAPMACLLSAAASLLEASQLLGQPNGSGISAAADREEADGGGNAPAAHEEAADLNAALPSYLSLACDLLQDHRPTKGDGTEEVRDWKLLQKPLCLVRAAASMLEHMPPGTWMRLAALHIHSLAQLSPHMVDPGPQRQLTVSLGIILPAELEAPGSKGSGHAAAFHHSLLLSVQDLARAAEEADLQELYASAPQLLRGYSDKPDAACALLQVMLLLVESAHSGPARKMLNRYAQGLASALMSHVLTHKAQTPKGSMAAAQCLALRCLEALAVRDSVVKLSGQLVGAILHLPYELLNTARSPIRSGGVFTACCHALLGMVRHRTAAVRRCMALLAASTRALLQNLTRWQAPRHADVARQCAEHLSHLFEDISERKEVLGMYCHFILADYITLAAVPLHTAGLGGDHMSSRQQQAANLLPAPAAALKPGACALYGACSPAQVQHVYTVLQKSGGGTRQAAMTALRQMYESTVKFSGKI